MCYAKVPVLPRLRNWRGVETREFAFLQYMEVTVSTFRCNEEKPMLDLCEAVYF